MGEDRRRTAHDNEDLVFQFGKQGQRSSDAPFEKDPEVVDLIKIIRAMISSLNAYTVGTEQS